MTATELFITPDISYRLELASAWRGVRYAEAYRKLHPLAASAALPVAGGYAVFISPTSPVNSTRGLGLSGPVSPGDLDAVEDFFHSRGAPVSIDVSPLCDESLPRLLNERGYRMGYFFSVLGRAIPADFQPGPLPPDVTITTAQPEQADLWIDITGRGFDDQEAPTPATVDILGPNFHAEDSTPYLAWIDDPETGQQPAGGGGMYVHQGVVELGGASTRMTYRRRGVQRALIDARLARACEQGCDLAMVLTEPGSRSQRNVERAEFSLAYTKVVLILTKP